MRDLTGPVVGLAFLGGVGGAIALADDPFPRPWATGAEVRTYFRGNRGAARLSAAGQAVSALAIARFTRTVARRSPRHRLLAVAGGTVAAVSIATSAVLAATQTARDVDDDTALQLARTAFAAGGPMHGVGFGALTAALVLGGADVLPRGLVVTGLVSAACGAASPLYFVWSPAGWLIPAGRFPGLVVAAVAGPLLSADPGGTPVVGPVVAR
ncbi:hypothetical protein EV188_102229 [Actinomycetospora succinea]|uniref:Uncharacterized protein n=1 Tax=Actinomycetospora succinea TaxID=663603 RepID=A0A4R6VKX0_9PSEU|nr:hypothetical protein [Actinomycetospora succinea]TDQ62575.1 hypothetical protein EV188_102229 [Actinomycetospora succinea]